MVYDRRMTALSWTRMAPTLAIDQYGVGANSTNLWTQRAVSFRIWSRIAWAPLYPTAINVVTRLTFTQYLDVRLAALRADGCAGGYGCVLALHAQGRDGISHSERPGIQFCQGLQRPYLVRSGQYLYCGQ